MVLSFNIMHIDDRAFQDQCKLTSHETRPNVGVVIAKFDCTYV